MLPLRHGNQNNTILWLICIHFLLSYNVFLTVLVYIVSTVQLPAIDSTCVFAEQCFHAVVADRLNLNLANL